MTTIKDIFRDYGNEYIQRFGDRMPADHRKVIDAIINCRSGHYGASIYQCTRCGKNHVVYRCCGNRHCLRLSFPIRGPASMLVRNRRPDRHATRACRRGSRHHP